MPIPPRKHTPPGAALTLVLTLSLMLAPAGYTRQGDKATGPQEDPAPGKSENANKGGQGGERRSDPCDHDPRGNAYGRDKLCPPDGSSGGVARGDFNFDGFGDLAIGVPGEDIADSRTGTLIANAGAVNVIYGSGAGLSATAGPGDQFWHQNSLGILDAAEADDRFGDALASGDFNNDGFSDLAVGVRGEDLIRADGRTLINAGAVNVIYGSAGGLTSAGNQLWHQDTAGVLENSQESDEFGHALNWGDFNGDGFGDLAVGVPGEDVGPSYAGAVHIIYGSGARLSATAGPGNQFWHEGVLNDSQPSLSARFGSALAAGDFNGDGRDDLAVGVRGKTISSISNAGAVYVLYGSPSEGLTNFSNFWHQDVEGILGDVSSDDSFGAALAAGDFNGDGRDDLAVGLPYDDSTGAAMNTGSVNVIYGSAGGLTAAGNQIWHQERGGIADSVETGDEFGAALAAGDFNADGRKDLAVGVPGEDLGSNVDAGVVHVIYGSGAGLYARQPDDQRLPPGALFSLLLDQASATGGANLPEAIDRFGSALTAWDFGFNVGVADLAVGVPLEDVGSLQNAGAVSVVYGVAGSVSGNPSFANAQHWTQDSAGIEDQAEAGDEFGRAVY